MDLLITISANRNLRLSVLAFACSKNSSISRSITLILLLKFSSEIFDQRTSASRYSKKSTKEILFSFRKNLN
jgi:hypothetical protein